MAKVRVSNYRKKPTVIEAVEVEGTEDNARAIAAWLKVPFRPDVDPEVVHVQTPKGSEMAHTGDYIIREGTGDTARFNVIERKVFEEEYEEVEVDLPRSSDETAELPPVPDDE